MGTSGHIWRLWSLAACIGSTACVEENIFLCDEDSQCERDGKRGSCRAPGFCAFPDATCESGERFAVTAPSGVGGLCVASGESSTTSPADNAEPEGPPEDEHSTSSGSVESSTAPVRTSPAPEPRNIAFVSAAEVPLIEVGLTGADAVCQAEAEAAGLAGTYLAFLASGAEGPGERFSGVAGWVRPDGAPVLALPFGLEQGRLLRPIHQFADGTSAGSIEVVTGASSSGNASDHCGDWMEPLGHADAGRSGWGGVKWYSGREVPCSEPSHVYCLGADHFVEFAPTPEGGRRAFATHGRIRGDAGLTAFDDLCNAEAAEVQLDGRFLAAVAVGTLPIYARFDLEGPPWINALGVPIVAQARDLELREDLLGSLSHDASGTPLPHGASVWTGSISPISPADNCGSWTGQAGEDSGHRSLAGAVFDWLSQGSTIACSDLAHLYCLQEAS